MANSDSPMLFDDDSAFESARGVTEALGQSEVFLAFQERLSRVAPIDRPVLLVGERGTGKELAAGRLHYLSRRWQHPLVTLNCSALSPSLIESELFGHEKGAFTGADRRRAGRFEMADRGSFFLDEIGNIPRQAQEKILRVVEYAAFERVGGTQAIEVDVRIIAATNADLAAAAEQGRFMKDLLDRLSFEVLYVPPLRVRQGDIRLLAGHFAARMAYEMGRAGMPRFGPNALDALEAYHWPGNIRELKNVVERAVYRAESDVITRVVFDPFANPYPTAAETAPSPKAAPTQDPDTAAPAPAPGAGETERASFDEAVWRFKVGMLEDALARARFNQKRASELLGMTYHQFRALYRKYRKLQS